jgi:hypothetical protein
MEENHLDGSGMDEDLYEFMQESNITTNEVRSQELPSRSAKFFKFK